MSLSPVLFVGCGGKGVETVAAARRKIAKRLETLGYVGEIPRAFQFVGIDGPRQYFHAQKEPFSDFDYVSLWPKSENPREDPIRVAHREVHRIFLSSQDRNAEKSLFGWQVNPPLDLPKDINSRPLSRLIGLLTRVGDLRERIQFALNSLKDGTNELDQVSQSIGLGQVDPAVKPTVVVVSSMFGRTGSSIMLDVIELISSLSQPHGAPALIAYDANLLLDLYAERSPEISAAFLSELFAACNNPSPVDSGLLPFVGQATSRTPRGVFFVGAKHMGGFETHGAVDTTASLLAVLATSSTTARAFGNYLDEFNLSRRSQVLVESELIRNDQAFVSSVGLASVSVGRSHFREYLKGLVGRKAYEVLVAGYIAARSEFKDPEMSRQKAIDSLVLRDLEVFLKASGIREMSDGQGELTPQAAQRLLSESSSYLSRYGLGATADLIQAASADVNRRGGCGPLVLILNNLARRLLAIEQSLARAEGVHNLPTPSGEVPPRFRPNQNEVLLESHERWSQDAPRLIREWLPAGLPDGLDPLDALVRLIVVGWREQSGTNSEIPPLLQVRASGEQTSKWSGNVVEITNSITLESLMSRVEAWLMCEDSLSKSFFTAGLSSFIDGDRSVTTVEDSLNRSRRDQVAAKFSQAVFLASPLLYVSSENCSMIHGEPPQPEILIEEPSQGASEALREAIRLVASAQEFPVNVVTSDNPRDDPDQVEIVALLHRTVHATATRSIDLLRIRREFNHNRDTFNYVSMQRARTLGECIPVPRGQLRTMVCGYAHARLLGLMTPSSGFPYEIARSDGLGVVPFPIGLAYRRGYSKPLITYLLASYINAYVDPESFRAFDELLKWGSCPPMVKSILIDGDYGKLHVPNQPRADKLLESDSEARIRSVLETLDGSIVHFAALASAPIKNDYWWDDAWRDRLEEGFESLELADDFVAAFGVAKQQVMKIRENLDV